MADYFRIRRFRRLPSTNTWCEENLPMLRDLDVALAVDQTAGRGQRGNKWESAPGQNLTFTIVFRSDNLPSHRQFLISEVVTLGIRDYLGRDGVEARIKWPNDIYVGDRKICGILISHIVNDDKVSASIAGIGLNINQKRFLSDAPNPVSLRNLTGHRYCLHRELKLLLESILPYWRLVCSDAQPHLAKDIEAEFTSSLYRLGESHSFIETATSKQFEATISGIDNLSRLLLTLPSGEVRAYAFKEVQYII